METSTVDPRDQLWQLEHPKYRVYFHDANGSSEEYEISGADVDQVLSWAQLKKGDRTFVLYACVPLEGLGLVRLLGRDPNGA